MSIRHAAKRRGREEVDTDLQWEADVQLPGGGRHRRRFKTRREAVAYEGNVRLQVAAGTFGVEVKETPTVEGFSERYLEWCSVHTKPSDFVR